MHALTIENVHKSFGPTKVLEGINIEIDAGQFLILVGPSGCGKSTLLHMIAGLEMVTEGRIHIGDRDVTHLSPKDRNIAMVFQSYALYPNMNVERNISFGLEIQKVPRQEREAKVAEVAKILQIESLLDRKPSQLSGGQRQRVAMGRALARDPSIFLFDEPLSNLDAKLRVEMRSEIKLLHERLAATIVYVTHDQIEAMTMGDRIAVMHQGRIQQFGSPGEIYEKPANMFVAGFIGSPSMNFLPVQVARWQSEIGAEVQGSSDAVFVPLPTGESLNGWVGRNAVLGVRPEQLHAAPASGGDAIACNVDLLEPTGPDTLVTVRLNGKKAVARLRPDKVSAIGETLGLTVDSDKTVLFDPKSEQRII